MRFVSVWSRVRSPQAACIYKRLDRGFDDDRDLLGLACLRSRSLSPGWAQPSDLLHIETDVCVRSMLSRKIYCMPTVPIVYWLARRVVATTAHVRLLVGTVMARSMMLCRRPRNSWQAGRQAGILLIAFRFAILSPIVRVRRETPHAHTNTPTQIDTHTRCAGARHTHTHARPHTHTPTPHRHHAQSTRTHAHTSSVVGMAGHKARRWLQA